MKQYAVKLDKWASATWIEAKNETQAKEHALSLYPVCDCGCGEATNAEWAKEIPEGMKAYQVR